MDEAHRQEPSSRLIEIGSARFGVSLENANGCAMTSMGTW
jgi:glutamate synthase domain-containing protein 2